ncbi:MAG TPA: hypothetical protein VKU36_01930 [Candidatus Babeliales bacterium]|nr:hypothetical protein [Candidatus Babeliales bacterium]
MMIKYIKKNRLFFGLSLAILILLPSCVKVPTYYQRPLKSVGTHFMYYGDNNKVIVRAKALNTAERHALFGGHIQELHDKDNRPLQIIYVSIHNLTDADYILCGDDINLKQITYLQLNKLMKKTSSMRRLAIAGLGGGGFYALCYGMWQVVLSPGGGILITVFGLPMIGCIVGGAAAVTLGSIQGIRSIVMNRRISKDLKEKILHEKVIINSGGCYEGLIFVKSSDYKPQFNVTIHEKDSGEDITFDVDLK